MNDKPPSPAPAPDVPVLTSAERKSLLRAAEFCESGFHTYAAAFLRRAVVVPAPDLGGSRSVDDHGSSLSVMPEVPK